MSNTSIDLNAIVVPIIEEKKSKPKKFIGKVTQLIGIDKELWSLFEDIRQPYGTVNDLFEDCIRVLVGVQPIHVEILERLNIIVPILYGKDERINKNIGELKNVKYRYE